MEKNKESKETKKKPAKKSRHMIFVISGPGGAGKTTITNQLFTNKKINDNFFKGITVTTREKREKEKDGVDYFFVTKEEFTRFKKNKFFLETQEVLGNFYGTPKILQVLAKKRNKGLILCIDVKGGMNLKENFRGSEIITIFIGAPSEADLCRRMGKRSEDKAIIKKRIELAKKEMKFSRHYDYVITNKAVKGAVEKLEKIIQGYKHNKPAKGTL